MENGKPKKGLNGHAAAVRRDSPKAPKSAPRPSLTKRLLNTIARILAWMAIINVLFRCPDTLDQCDEESPLFCKQYFQAKQAVLPIVKPYYDTHAAPYVDLAKPYYHAVDRTLITPANAYAVMYVAPRIQQGSVLAKDQWDRVVAPEVAKAQAAVAEKYDDKVAPHVTAIVDAASPYLDIAKTNALQTYHEFLLPAYVFAQPYVIQGYSATSTFVTNTVVPATIWAFNKTYAFLDDAVLPQIRLLYAETVEPQLVRIGQRLGRYNGSKPKAGQAPEHVSAGATTAAYSSFTKPTPVSASSAAPASASSATSSVASSTSASSASTITPSASPSDKDTATGDAVEEATATRALLVQPPPIVENESERRRETRIELTKDMISWQEKFMDAAETGAREIEEKVVDICGRMESQEVDITGKQAVSRFVDHLDEEMAALRLEIMNIVETVPDQEEAAEQVTAAVRRAGISLKDRAQKIRVWREKFERDLHAAINQAAHAHFSLMDNIQDLAVQKMGMKWAWMEGVTYKDWKLYHAMKAEFISWREELERSVVTHRSLERTTNAAADIEDLGMLHAKDAALELKRLKEVGHWKIAAGDSSDNFNSDQMRQAAEAKVNQASDAKADAVDQQDAVLDESVDQISHEEPMVEQAIAKDAVLDNSANEGAVIPDGDAQAPLWDDVSVPGESTNTETEADTDANTDNTLWSDTAAPLEEEASFSTQVELDDGSMVSDEYDPEASAEILVVGVSVDKAASAFSSAAEEVGSMSVNMNDGTPTIVANQSEATKSADASSEPEPSIESIAEEANEPIVEPEDAAEKESEDDVSDDLSSPESSPTSIKPALFGAAAQVVPGRQPELEEDEYDMAAEISSMASAAFSTATSLASMQYSLAVSMVSAQVGSSTPKPIHEEMLSSVSSAYSNALDQASSRLDEALEAASAHIAATSTGNSAAESVASEATAATDGSKDEL